MKSLAILIATFSLTGCVTTPQFEQDITGQWQCSADATFELANLRYSDRVHYYNNGFYEKDSVVKVTNLNTDITYNINVTSSGKWIKRNTSLLEVINNLETTFSDNTPEEFQEIFTNTLSPTVTQKWKLSAVNENNISMTTESGDQLFCQKG
ncbi:hypothetical protein TW84_12130 [Vibrio neptunius]|uniref:hypothetical protein n=1 Tax=Vibrio neptunius TaxID=170651 RepID=UPI0005F9B310|nr:hypothetical protein [Vibrio neptunius]KJY89480.1 hypothetical protein TW84_12130 [Vibrio neptunius]